MSQIARLDVTHTQLLVVDIQEKLTPYVVRRAEMVAQSVRMIEAAKLLDLPVSVSEHYAGGLGRSEQPILDAAADAPRLEKIAFSVCGDEQARERIVSLKRPAIVIVGIETHVCVQQTALDLLEMQMQPFVLADAVSSRRQSDYEFGLRRMEAAGVVVTTVEAAIFELLERAGTDLFRRVAPLLR